MRPQRPAIAPQPPPPARPRFAGRVTLSRRSFVRVKRQERARWVSPLIEIADSGSNTVVQGRR